MSVATFDHSFSFKQDAVARLGDRANDYGRMSADDRTKFQNSPFMQKVRESNNLALDKLSKRDKKRAQNDPNFKPSDDDFNAPKAHQYNHSINYYKVLGIDEYASHEAVKKAYRKLSLTYHPDKTTGMSQEEKDEYAAIFIELKNAYKTLSDNATRRQYDHDRDREAANNSLYGGKTKEMASFDAFEAMKKLAEKALEKGWQPGEIVDVAVRCRLEKFIYGGHKAIKRSRRVKVKGMNAPEFTDDLRLYRLDVPSGASEPFAVEFKRQGDQHADRDADTVRFLVSSKAHERIDRKGNDLMFKSPLDWGGDWRRQPYIKQRFPALRGQQIILWGRNPFFQIAAGNHAEMRIRLSGDRAEFGGSLSFSAHMKLGDEMGASCTSSVCIGSKASSMSSDNIHDFLKRHNMGPLWGMPSKIKHDSISGALPSAYRKRTEKTYLCDAHLVRVAGPIALFTKPPSAITLYFSDNCSRDVSTHRTEGNFAKLSRSTTVTPEPMLAICLSSPACAKRNGMQYWDMLKEQLAPLLQQMAFSLLRGACSILPRTLTADPHIFGTVLIHDFSNRPQDNHYVKRLGNQAYTRGDYWQAIALYTQCLQELPSNRLQNEAEEASKLFANRAACLAKVGEFTVALLDAERACELAPQWFRSWSRLGQALHKLEGATQKTVDAYSKAVELNVNLPDVEALASVASECYGVNIDTAHTYKERGNEAVRKADHGTAVAIYTLAIVQLPLTSDTTASDRNGQPDDHSLLRAILYTNRSACFARLRLWGAAVADSRAAVNAQPSLSKARCQLATVLLASGLHEQSYAEFAKALLLDSANKIGHKGRQACLAELQCWRSVPARSRVTARFSLDASRPFGSTRIFAISDLHFDHKCNEEWAHSIDDLAFRDDVLIVAGNVADSMVGTVRGLTVLKSKFRRVFYTVGNHEMFIHHSEFARYPDSLTKLHAILAACDDLGVDVFPAAVCAGLFIVPLFSWYNAEFDEQDPFPSPHAPFDSNCKWPMDPDVQLWKYMMKLNEPHLRLPYHGTTITFSHFLPRRDLPFDKQTQGLAKAMGCEPLDRQVRVAGSKLHVFGHSRQKHAQIHDGVRYVHMPVGYENERGMHEESVPRLMLIHNARSLCMRQWDVRGEAVYGTSKRILHITFYSMPNLTEGSLQRNKLRTLAEKCQKLSGIHASFCRAGSRDLDKEQFRKQFWPELMDVSNGASHMFLLVADNLAAFRNWLHSAVHKEWLSNTAPLTKTCAALNTALSVDLPQGKVSSKIHERSDDSTLVPFFLRLRPDATEESEAYCKLQRAVAAINALPGAAGRMAASLEPAGFEGFSGKQLLEEMQWPDDKSHGFTHCFMVAIDSPQSLQNLFKSKTFERWRSACEACMLKQWSLGSPVLACPMPVNIAVTSAAPPALTIRTDGTYSAISATSRRRQ